MINTLPTSISIKYAKSMFFKGTSIKSANFLLPELVIPLPTRSEAVKGTVINFSANVKVIAVDIKNTMDFIFKKRG